MEKTWIHSRTTQADDGTSLELAYYLLTEPGTLGDSYGVEVVLSRGGRREAAAIADITPIGTEILSLIDRLANGTVTPTGLKEVLPELLA